MTQPLLILIAGPYRSGTNDDPKLIAANVRAMTAMTLRVFRAGHLPVTSEWLALPLVEHAGSRRVGDEIFDEIFHPIARRLVQRCDCRSFSLPHGSLLRFNLDRRAFVTRLAISAPE